MITDETSRGAPVLTGRDRQREETRRRVYEAAITVFKRDGVAGSRISDITALAGVSHGTFYFHFPTKEDVLMELQRESEQRVSAAIEALPEDTAIDPLLEVVSNAIAREWKEEAGLFPDVGTVALRSLSIKQLSQPEPGSIRWTLAQRFRKAADGGELNQFVPPELLSDLLLVNLFAATMGWCSNPEYPLELVLAMTVSLFLNGARGATG